VVKKTLEPPEIIEVDKTTIACDGGGGVLGHPRVFLRLVKGKAACGYCDRMYIFKSKNATP